MLTFVGICLQLDTYNSDIAKLLLISRAIVLICWPAEEYAVNNGKPQSRKKSVATATLQCTDLQLFIHGHLLQG